MSNTLSLLKVHIRCQKYLYLVPILFMYLIFLPYQYQILQVETIDDMVMLKIYNSAQIFLLIFAVWYQFVGLRIDLYHGLRELSCGVYRKGKFCWCICCLLTYLILLMPYFVWLFLNCGAYKEMIFALIFQVCEISIITVCVIRILNWGRG